MKTLVIFIEKEHFDKIVSGIKHIEYREVKPFWKTRLFDKDGEKRKYDQIEFINGMRPDSPRLIAEYLGFEEKDKFYHIKIGKILKTLHLKKK